MIKYANTIVEFARVRRRENASFAVAMRHRPRRTDRRDDSSGGGPWRHEHVPLLHRPAAVVPFGGAERRVRRCVPRRTPAIRPAR